jgi:hypothetical protein
MPNPLDAGFAALLYILKKGTVIAAIHLPYISAFYTAYTAIALTRQTIQTTLFAVKPTNPTLSCRRLLYRQLV